MVSRCIVYTFQFYSFLEKKRIPGMMICMPNTAIQSMYISNFTENYNLIRI